MALPGLKEYRYMYTGNRKVSANFKRFGESLDKFSESSIIHVNGWCLANKRRFIRRNMTECRREVQNGQIWYRSVQTAANREGNNDNQRTDF